MATTETAPTEPENSPAETAAKPKRGRPFSKGASPNPGGRPKVPAEVKEAFRAHLAPKALKVIEQILRSPKHPHRHAVAMYVVDRVLGKPTAAITGADGQPLIPATTSPDNPLAKLLAAVVARRSAADTGTGRGPTEPANEAPASNGEAPGGADA